MSEQLIQDFILKSGKYDNYELLSIGSVTFNQLIKNKKINDFNLKEYIQLKPDGLLLDSRNKKNVIVHCVIEVKTTEEFNTTKKKDIAIKQCNTYCQLLNSKFGVITDGKEFIWINPNFKSQENEYNDNEIFDNKPDVKRSFSFIIREDGYNLEFPFVLNYERKNETENTIKVIKKVLEVVDSLNTQFKQLEYINPSKLAQSIWQDVWISKNAKPEKALSTFIEIFMFKFLSDLGVLKRNSSGIPISFEDVIDSGKHNCLKYYFDSVRNYLNELFPPNINDSTTLINGIELNPNVKVHNLQIFNILKRFEDFGDLKNIDPEFKSRLFEDFLKKSISKKDWGQFFTPRNVVKAIIEMSNIDKLPDNAIVCDPACGVGGFILEPIITKRQNDYYFEDNKLKSKLKYLGYEKGFTQEDKLTTVLAKANFVIYLSDLLKENPSLTKEFASVFNDIFKVYDKSILGSLSEVKENKYDLIISNPPYVTKGTVNLKNAIKDANLNDFYKLNAYGTEGLFIEKMITELTPKGTAILVIPYGILHRTPDTKLREFIKENCVINAIIALPKNTFYTTPIETYIVSLTEKEDKCQKQTEPVYTYLIKDIGETLNVDRFPEPEKNDLKDMVKQYKYFLIDKNDFTPFNNKCKIQSIDKFIPEKHWRVEKWWTKNEKIELGVEEKEAVLNYEDLINYSDKLQSNLLQLTSELKSEITNYKVTKLSLDEIIDFSITTNASFFTKKFINQNKGDIPVYSASKDPDNINYGLVKDNVEKIKYFENCLTWNIDGSIGKAHYRSGRFTLSEKVIPLILKEEYIGKIDYIYLKYFIEKEAIKLGFTWSNKANKGRIKEIEIPFPINDKSEIDLDKQRIIASKYEKINELKNEIVNSLFELTESEFEF